MNKKKIQALILFLILLAGFSYAYYNYVLSRQLNVIKEYETDIQKYQADLDRAREIQNDKKNALNKIAKLEKELEGLNKVLPDAGYASQADLEIYNILKNSEQRGLKVTNANPKDIEEEKGKKYSYKEINITVSGKKEELINFIKYLQQYRQAVKIKETKVRLINSEELEANMRINIYFES